MEMGGAQVLTVGLLNEMCKENEVTLIIINNKWNNVLLSLLDKRVKILYIKRKQGNRSIVPVIRLNMLLFKLKADIIHCHEPNMAKLIVVKWAKLFQTIHDVGISTRYYHLYDNLIAISDSVYNDIAQKIRQSIKIIYNGVPLSAFRRRDDYSSPKNTIRLAQISRLIHEKKGQDILIHAMRKLVYDLGISNCVLDIIGTGASHNYLEGLIANLNLTANVNLIGEKDRPWIMDNLCTYHILVQPSRYEGFGLTIIEGFAAGLPVLASNIDGPAEIIAGLPAGFLFENEDHNNCADVLKAIIDCYARNEVRELVCKTMPVINEKYSMASCAPKYIQEYKNAFNKAKTPSKF